MKQSVALASHISIQIQESELRVATKRLFKPKTYIYIILFLKELLLLRFIRVNQDKEIIQSPRFGNERRLAELFQEMGSDKATQHDYATTYEEFMSESRGNEGSLLEIGLGTNNLTIPSNMGGHFVTCGSLLAWKEYFPKFQVFGADIDSSISINESRIKICWVDQTQPKTFIGIENMLQGMPIDFLIVDGLHQPFADLVTLRKLLPYIKRGGSAFVEDIEESKFVRLAWRMVAVMLPEKFTLDFRAHLLGGVAVIQRKR